MQRKASAVWKGGLKDGQGSITAPGGVLSNTPYSFTTRFENAPGTNPEELIAAAHAACFSMALSAQLGSVNLTPENINTNVTLTFDLNRDIDSAVTDVQGAISAALPLLPPTLTAPPSFRKANPADQPILQINLISDTLDMTAVDAYAEDILAPRISMVLGVSQVNVQG